MTRKILIIVVCALLLIGSFLVFKEFVRESNEIFEVSQIIDGDTIKLANGDRVRLIGINTPERDQPYYSEATEKLTKFIGNNSVTLEKDVRDKDPYGRLLRYVYIGNTHVNLEMVRQGFAIAYHYPPNIKYSDDFEDAEQEARNSQLGIWSPSEFSLVVSHMHADAEGNDNENLNDEYVVFENNGDSPMIMMGWTVQDEANNLYAFPTFILGNGSSVTLYTGEGIDNDAKVYWGNDKPIWNNDGDTLYLRDAEGYLVTFYNY